MKMAELAQYLPFAEYKVQINEGEFAFDYTIASKVNDYIIGIGVLIWILLSCFAILIDFIMSHLVISEQFLAASCFCLLQLQVY